MNDQESPGKIPFPVEVTRLLDPDKSFEHEHATLNDYGEWLLSQINFKEGSIVSIEDTTDKGVCIARVLITLKNGWALSIIRIPSWWGLGIGFEIAPIHPTEGLISNDIQRTASPVRVVQFIKLAILLPQVGGGELTHTPRNRLT